MADRLTRPGRREFLKGTALALGGLAAGGPAALAGRARCESDGMVAHVLPTVSHDRMLIKVSFAEPQGRAPVLRVGERRVSGIRTDTAGAFWAFDVDGLKPGRRHELELRQGGCRLGAPWELSTFPAPDTCPEHFRLLIYTCAGGHDLFPLYVPAPIRQRLLRRALSFAPDAAVAAGDHVYWDLRSFPNALFTGASQAACEAAAKFDRALPVLGTPNEDVLKVAVGAQVADLYGTMFQSVPVFFVRDDHDYFEDDRATEELVTFPADPFMFDLARSAQWLYYPEFLPDPWRPLDLPASSARDRPRAVSEAFGTLRYGQLAELLLYDCKGFVTLDGPDGRMVPATVESWLRARMADPCQRHVVNVPSNPPGWSAGKYGEWYPDVVVDPGQLTTAVPKDGWQPGWLAQHDRLLAAASAMPRLPLFLAGDIHSIAEERILASGAHSFAANPIVSVITGTPGTGVGWPSVARQTLAMPPSALAVEEIVPVQERNGFHLVDFEPDRVVIRHFRWHYRHDPEEAIDSLEPFHVSEHPR
jgi:hypothetical protein